MHANSMETMRDLFETSFDDGHYVQTDRDAVKSPLDSDQDAFSSSDFDATVGTGNELFMDTFSAQSQEGVDMDMDMDMNKTDTNLFCKSSMGGGMIMYMDGFRFSLKGNQPCLNLLLPGWTLDTPAKFSGAIVGVFLMAVLVEGLSKLRLRVGRCARRRSTMGEESSHLHGALTVMHGLQALLGYLIMLITMTFSIELLVAIVVGLSLGYYIFFQLYAEGTMDMDVIHHVTTNPCCEYMTEEAREVPHELNNQSVGTVATNSTDLSLP